MLSSAQSVTWQGFEASKSQVAVDPDQMETALSDQAVEQLMQRPTCTIAVVSLC